MRMMLRVADQWPQHKNEGKAAAATAGDEEEMEATTTAAAASVTHATS